MTLSQASLTTLAYHDIFDYPLTTEEIYKYLIGKKSDPSRLKKELANLKASSKIGESKGYFYLKNRAKIANLRTQRYKYSKEKLKKAIFFANLLKTVPTLKLVAVSGALAMGNSHQRDDIDLVLITSRGSLWTTRFFANIILLPFKRKPASNRVNNRACLNLFLDASDLKIRPQNLYTAHEICQMKPLWDRDKTYSQFIRANPWVKKFLPNWQPQEVRSQSVKSKSKLDYSLFFNTIKKYALVFSILYSLAESFLKNFQLWYMRDKVSTERIGKHQLFFHPSNTQELVLAQYKKRLRRLKIQGNPLHQKRQNEYFLTSEIPL